MPPIYKTVCKITHKDAAEAEHTRLIEAPNMAAVMRYAAERWITIEKCTTTEAISLGAQGIKLEKSNGAAE